MKKIILFSLFLLPVLVFAQSEILQIDLLVFKNNTVIVRDISITSGNPLNLPSVGGAYSLRILDGDNDIVYQRDFDLNFIIFANQPLFVDSNTVFDKILYSTEMEKIQLLKNQEIIFQSFLKDYIKPSKPSDLILYIILILIVLSVVFYLYKRHKAT